MCRPEGHKESNWVVYRRVRTAASSPESPIITTNRKKSQMSGKVCTNSAGGKQDSAIYSTAAAPASNASDIIHTDRTVADEGCHRRIPLDVRANVVANCAVGFGPPLTDMVGLDDMGLEVELPPESTMENFCELAYRRPWVLFKNSIR
jgi:hypothetical protein